MPPISQNPTPIAQEQPAELAPTSKLWIYTNYDCNLSCTYCVAESTPRTPRRALSIEVIKQLVDEAVALEFEEIFFTGGEPFLLDNLPKILAYAKERINTTVLTNAMLFKGRRMDELQAIGPDNLTLQVSLDGGQAAHHNAYRGAGTWEKTVEGMRKALESGFHLRVSTTETPANSGHLDEICALHNSLGIPESDHIIRPLAKRGFSTDGLEVGKSNLNPEITVNVDGVFWHPLSQDEDMRLSCSIFPLKDALNCLHRQLAEITQGQEPMENFT